MATRVFASPNARRLAREAGLRVEDLKGTGPGGRIIGRDVKTATVPAPIKSNGGVPQISVRATVRARRLLKLRDRLNADDEPVRTSLDDLLVKAAARTHRLVPRIDPEVINLGEYGTEQFDAAVRPDLPAVLAVGAVHHEPVVRKDKVRPAAVMRVTLSVDPRAVDVTAAAKWMRTFVGLLHNPARILL